MRVIASIQVLKLEIPLKSSPKTQNDITQVICICSKWQRSTKPCLVLKNPTSVGHSLNMLSPNPLHLKAS